MTPEEQDRVIVVLVRARNPANIGAVARAMQDFGFKRLRVVNPYPIPFQAAKSAVGAASVLAAAQEHRVLSDALTDCTLVLGTTAVGDRAITHPLRAIAEAGEEIREALATHPRTRVALLFGSEKTGLTNEELSHCHALVTIPMSAGADGRHLSMNLGQAAAVCLYVIAARPAVVPAAAAGASATGPALGGDRERLFTLLKQTLQAAGYTRRHPANSREAALRRLVTRLELDRDDAAVWSGVFRQLLHALGSAPASSAASGPEPDGPEPSGPEPDGPEPNGPEPNGPEPDNPE